MSNIKLNIEKKHRRKARVRAKIFGTGKKPRLSVFRSSKHIYGQLVNDEKNAILVSANDIELANRKTIKGKIDMAKAVGKLIAEKVKKLPGNKQVDSVVFDRGSYKYHGRVRALAEGAREGGLLF